MNQRLIIILMVFIVGLTSCQSKSNFSKGVEQPIAKFPKEVNTPFLDSIWNQIIHQNGCLTGGQYHKDGKFGNEGNIMNRSEKWKKFYQLPKDSLTYFLLSKFDKTDSTYIHTCPFFNATEGELAVYALQRIHGKNWLNKEILQVPSERKKLQDYFLNEL